MLLSAGSIAGEVYNDKDANGQLNGTEPGLQNRKVFVDLNANGQPDAGEPATKTDSKGLFHFNGLAAKTYLVGAVEPAGWRQTSPADGAEQSVVVSAGQQTAGVRFGSTLVGAAAWAEYGRDLHHTAISTVASQPLATIRWQTPVDTDPQFSGNDLLIHYGSPVITAANTIIVPVKTGADGNFELQARRGSNGALLWKQASDYVLPPHGWTPSFPTALVGDRVYFAGPGGTIYYRDHADSAGPAAPSATGQIAFYGNAAYYAAHKAAYDATVFIDTPITVDKNGNLFFGFQVTGDNPLHLKGGIARLSAVGHGTYVAAATAAGDASIAKVVQNCAPALNIGGSLLYVAVNQASFSGGYLLALNSKTLATVAKVALLDPSSGDSAVLPDDGTASPTVGPDGDVYFGVLESSLGANHLRGWLLHFNRDLSLQRTPGSFGWDDTASIVPASMVASYHGTSKYLLMTKYNDYVEGGGAGDNRIAILDPNAQQIDPVTGAKVMKEVETIAGVTPDSGHPEVPGAVREWCINDAVVDPATDSILAGSEDGRLYRWNLGTNTFTESITLTPGIGEAYTPTLIGPDGTVYAINDATLFALGTAILSV